MDMYCVYMCVYIEREKVREFSYLALSTKKF